MVREFDQNSQGAQDFRIDRASVSPRANEVARILEGPTNPTNPRYDNLEMGPLKDIVIRSEKGQPLEMNRDEFNDAVDVAQVFVEARREEEAAKDKKDNAAAALIGLARRIPFFRGVGFPEENASATIVAVKNKSIKDENVGELVKQAGVELQEFGTVQIQLIVDVPVSLTDRQGNTLSVHGLEKRLSNYLGKILRPEDKGLVKINGRLKIHNWKKLAELIRNGKVSHELIDADEDYIAKPIALSQVKEQKPRPPKRPRLY